MVLQVGMSELVVFDVDVERVFDERSFPDTALFLSSGSGEIICQNPEPALSGR